MIRPEFIYNQLVKNDVGFFTGVPDSLLKSFCAYLTDNSKSHIIAANEGCATGLASGYYFATGKIPLVYMQNSGIGNAVNPLMSLVDPDVYSIPLLLFIGWRGEPGVHDEPQHIKQGKVTCDLLDAMKIPYFIMSDNEDELQTQIEKATQYAKQNNAPYAFVIKKGTFEDYKLINNVSVDAEMSREEAIEEIIQNAPTNAAFVSTTGMASRELYELRDRYNQGHEKDFLTVGSMGHASQIALSIALQKKERPIFCIDGDGASIMQMGGMATIGTQNPNNLIHIVMNNGAHDSVGGQPTVAREIDLCAIATSVGYKNIILVKTKKELEVAMRNPNTYRELSFIEVLVKKGARKDLGRPKTTPIENKNAFMEFLSK